jgi:uncharacterized protein
MEKRIKVVLDTNILISAIGFGGKPREILFLVFDKKLKAISSPILFAEFEDVISKKFPKLADHLEKINKQLKKHITIVKPKSAVHLVQDEPDNRVIEAALEGNCAYIITGDNDLLRLKKFKNISIVKPEDFLLSIQN